MQIETWYVKAHIINTSAFDVVCPASKPYAHDRTWTHGFKTLAAAKRLAKELAVYGQPASVVTNFGHREVAHYA